MVECLEFDMHRNGNNLQHGSWDRSHDLCVSLQPSHEDLYGEDGTWRYSSKSTDSWAFTIKSLSVVNTLIKKKSLKWRKPRVPNGYSFGPTQILLPWLMDMLTCWYQTKAANTTKSLRSTWMRSPYFQIISLGDLFDLTIWKSFSF